MKTIKSLILATLFIVATSVSAAENPNSRKTNLDNASKEIAVLLKAPLFEVKEDMEAKVSLMVNQENELVVLSVDTSNKQLETFVKSRLNYQKITSVLETGVQYTLPLVVKSES